MTKTLETLSEGALIRATERVLWSRTLELWVFGWAKLPLLAHIRPRVVQVEGGSLGLVVPFGRRNRNHYGTMYFGALASTAEMLPGVLAVLASRAAGGSPVFYVKDLQGVFLHKAKGSVTFYEESPGIVERAVQRCLAQDQVVEQDVGIVGTSEVSGRCRVVASFRFTLSLRVSIRSPERKSIPGGTVHHGK